MVLERCLVLMIECKYDFQRVHFSRFEATTKSNNASTQYWYLPTMELSFIVLCPSESMDSFVESSFRFLADKKQSVTSESSKFSLIGLEPWWELAEVEPYLKGKLRLDKPREGGGRQPARKSSNILITHVGSSCS